MNDRLTGMPDNRKRRVPATIRTRMTVVLSVSILVVFSAMILVNIFGLPFGLYRGEYRSREEDAVGRLSLFADDLKRQVTSWFGERQSDARAFSENSRNIATINSLIRRYRAGGVTPGKMADEFRDLAEQIGMIRSVYSIYDAIDIVDPASGDVVLSTDEQRCCKEAPYGKQLSGLLRGGPERMFFSADGNQSSPHLNICHLVSGDGKTGRTDKAIAAVVFRIPVTDMADQLLSPSRALGLSGEVVLIDMERLILSPLRHHLPEGGSASPLAYRLETEEARYAAWGIAGAMYSTDYRGIPVLAAVRHLRLAPDFGIGMIVKQDRSEIMAPVYRSIFSPVFIMLAGLSLVVVTLYTVTAKLLRPLEDLSNTATRIGKGDLSARCSIGGTDEIGILSASFNSMADRFQSRHQEMEAEILRRTEAMSESEQKYRTLFEQAGDYILILEPIERKVLIIADANEAACAIHGYARDELLGMPITAIDEGLDEDSMRELTGRALAGETLRFETMHSKKDGTRFPVEVCSRLVEAKQGRPFFLSIERDITSRRQAEEEKGRLQDQLMQAQKMEAVGILAGGVAHDFNNILSAIVGYGSLLHLKMTDGDPLLQYVDHILASTERASELTKSLLAFSRKQVAELHPLNLNECLFRFHKIMARMVGEDIDCRLNLCGETLIVSADRGQLEQVLMNLATNARDAMPGGGRLQIGTERETVETDRGDITRGSYAVVSVSDSGSGMDDATREHIFEPFYTTKEVGKGTGLGLAIVHGIVRKHNGFIHVYSEPGGGTTFRIWLPLLPTTEIEQIPPEQAPLPRGTEVLLLVEDDAGTRQVARHLLEEYGYTVLEAVDGEDAVRMFRENSARVQLVLCDVIMPRRNGRQTYEELKRIQPDVRVIFMSGYPADIISQRGILEENVRILSKPLNPTELLTEIRDALAAGGR